LTWIECPFLSVALLRRLKTGFQLLTGTKRFFINTKFPRPLTTVKPRLKVVLHDSRGGAREARARVRAQGRMRARCWAPSSCRRPVSGAASGASVAGDQHNSWQHRPKPGFRGLPLRAVRQLCEAHPRGMCCPGRASVCIPACPAQCACTISLRPGFLHCRSTGHGALCAHVVKLLRWSGTHNMDIPHGCTVPLRWIIEESNAARAMSTRDSRCFFELHVLALQRETETCQGLATLPHSP
jgi:hypothetical protein